MPQPPRARPPARPRIGVTTYRETARWGDWDAATDLLPVTYSDAVWAAGGLPLLLPPAPAAHVLGEGGGEVDAEAVDAALGGLAALVLTGGPDVDPARYGAVPHPRTGRPRRDRDAWEAALVRRAVELDLPVLAICRGLQVLNTALGGDLVQHLPDAVGHDGHSPHVGAHGRHVVALAPGTALAAVLGETVTVATYHHQAVDRLAPGLVAVGWAEDGTVEAAVARDAPWVVGVQWHPEVHEPLALFTALVGAARGDARPVP